MSDIIKLDRIDYRILAALQENGRMPITQLAKIANISVSPCWQRVRHFERAGIVRRYIAEIALEKLQSIQIVLAHVILAQHNRGSYSAFETLIHKTPEAVECYEIAGQFDYHLKFVVTSMEHYNTILETLLESSAGVEKYFTYVVTRVAKESQAPLLSLPSLPA